MEASNTNQQIMELQAENRLLKKLVTFKGFYDEYFKELKNHRNRNEAFNSLNDKYFDLTGEYRYSSYNSFRNMISRKLK